VAPIYALDLRVLSMGDVADRAFAVFRARWLVLFAMATLSFGLFCFGWFFVAAAYAAAYFDNHVVSPFAVLLAAVMLAVFMAVIAGLLIDVTAAAHLGRPRGIVASVAVSLRTAPWIFLTGFPVALLPLVAFLLVWTVGDLTQSFPAWGLASLVGTIAVVYVEASWFVAPAVATVEGLRPIASLRRAWQLTGGFRWRVLGLTALAVALFATGFVSVFSLTAIAGIGAGQGLAATVPPLVLFCALVGAWLPFFFGTMTIVYYDLRFRKEGLDLQLSAEAMHSTAQAI